jgi:DNA-binding Xre family transcriptional regulator
MVRLRVKELAKARGFTMAGLQRAAEINLKTMQAIYRDPYRDVAYSTLYKIAKVLNVPITDLVEELADSEKNEGVPDEDENG